MPSLYAHTPTQTRGAAAVQYNTLCWCSIIVLYYEPFLFLGSLGLVSLPWVSVFMRSVFSTLVCFSCLSFRCLRTLCTVFNGIADSERNKALYDCCNDAYNTSSAVRLSMRYVQSAVPYPFIPVESTRSTGMCSLWLCINSSSCAPRV